MLISNHFSHALERRQITVRQKNHFFFSSKWESTFPEGFFHTDAVEQNLPRITKILNKLEWKEPKMAFLPHLTFFMAKK